MKMRKLLLYLFVLLFFSCSQKKTSTDTPVGDAGEYVSGKLPDISWFPSRVHAFVWRNWESVSVERMAKVLQTSTSNVLKTGLSMGLPPNKKPGDVFEQRGYISLIRRNWHLISYNQLLVLLDRTSEELDETLRDDDFLAHKVGGMKPICPDLKFTEPGAAVKERCAEIKKIVEDNFNGELLNPGEKRFEFIGNLSEVDKNHRNNIAVEKSEDGPMRFVYSYFAPFGDPLLHPELDPFPEGLLQKLQKQGVNGVWLHVTLHQLTSSKIFPELGARHETRLRNLRELARRTRKYGIKIYLYMNEPRALPLSFFENRQELLGIEERGLGSLCTSVPIVQQWLKESLSYVFSTIPELGGVFTISGSENLTSCWSHQNGENCTRCAKRNPEVVIAEVNRIIADGVWQGNPEAKVIVWDWGWPDGLAWGKNKWADGIIGLLPDNVYHMSVSEWSKPVDRGGVKTTVGEYSMSVVGPGPRAKHLWQVAQKRNLKTIAKIQVNNTWELSAIPYIPVMNLVAEHIKNLQNRNVNGLMLSWSLGGYPSPNMELVSIIQDNPQFSISRSLQVIAQKRYGENAAPEVLKAWKIFSDAFTRFPYGLNIYFPPLQFGVSNPLYISPSHLKATMLGFPFDDLEQWRGAYPDDVLASQFLQLADKWEQGIPFFEKAILLAVTKSQKENAVEDYRFAATAWNHFKSMANQTQFIISRNKILSGTLDPAGIKHEMEIVETVVNNEIELAKQMYVFSKADSRIGFEASNHYYYFPLDFVEKVINCKYVLAKGIGENYFEKKD